MLEFPRSEGLTMGVELELQVLSTRDLNLTRGADDLLAAVAKEKHAGEIKPEITESMIEMSTSIHTRHGPLLDELKQIRDICVRAADRLNLALAGGGAHPFQHWRERRIFDTPRFQYLSALYGYLAKQFTVFGQHVHIGCPDGDSALYLAHTLSRYMPHFIALAAASPFYQDVDTTFDSSRLNVINAFPLSGQIPYVKTWEQFNGYFEKMRGLGIVESMKDFYWDIRPKPEFGTIEIRVCDTPVTVDRAAALAAYAQSLSRYLLLERPHDIYPDMYLSYGYSRFQACRFGLHGTLICPFDSRHVTIADDVLATLQLIAPHASALEAEPAIAEIKAVAESRVNDATWMREQFAKLGTLADVMRVQAQRWRA